MGVFLAVLLVAWWLFFGRKGSAETNLVMLTPALGSLWMPFALPLLAGYFLPWRRAALTALLQGLLLILLQGGFIAGEPFTFLAQPLAQPLALLAQPLLWITLGALVLSAPVMALFARRQTRWAGLGGLMAAIVVLVLACVVAPVLIYPALDLVNIANTGIGLALSFILVLVLVSLGVPTTSGFAGATDGATGAAADGFTGGLAGGARANASRTDGERGKEDLS
jgi:hypothetical protein